MHVDRHAWHFTVAMKVREAAIFCRRIVLLANRPSHAPFHPAEHLLPELRHAEDHRGRQRAHPVRRADFFNILRVIFFVFLVCSLAHEY